MTTRITCNTMFRTAQIQQSCGAKSAGPLSGKQLVIWGWSRSSIAANGAHVHVGVDRNTLEHADIIILGGHHYTHYHHPERFLHGNQTLNLNRYVQPSNPIKGRKLVVITGCLGTNDRAMKYFRKRFPHSIVIGAAGSSRGKLSGLFVQFLADIKAGRVKISHCPSSDALAKAFVAYARAKNVTIGSGIGVFDAAANRRVRIQGASTTCHAY
ncbi:MAG: hypothetical protein J7M25_13455 [Deltaproteobacteria bacterium]|nr:hypothetical protein [Deltaproteobacteria bacterium]